VFVLVYQAAWLLLRWVEHVASAVSPQRISAEVLVRLGHAGAAAKPAAGRGRGRGATGNAVPAPRSAAAAPQPAAAASPQAPGAAGAAQIAEQRWKPAAPARKPLARIVLDSDDEDDVVAATHPGGAAAPAAAATFRCLAAAVPAGGLRLARLQWGPAAGAAAGAAGGWTGLADGGSDAAAFAAEPESPLVQLPSPSRQRAAQWEDSNPVGDDDAFGGGDAFLDAEIRGHGTEHGVALWQSAYQQQQQEAGPAAAHDAQDNAATSNGISMSQVRAYACGMILSLEPGCEVQTM